MGLFTEKSEVTINHRSNQELMDSLRAKIHKLMAPTEVEDVKTIKVNGETVDLDAELGIVDEEKTEEVKDDGNSKPA